jgi:hypothetical protein
MVGGELWLDECDLKPEWFDRVGWGLVRHGRRPLTGGLRAMTPLLIIPWRLSYGWAKSRNTSVRTGTVCSADLADLLGQSRRPYWFGVSLTKVSCDFCQPFVCTSIFHVAELRDSLHQLTITRISQPVLWCQIFVDLLVTDLPLARYSLGEDSWFNHRQLPEMRPDGAHIGHGLLTAHHFWWTRRCSY